MTDLEDLKVISNNEDDWLELKVGEKALVKGISTHKHLVGDTLLMVRSSFNKSFVINITDLGGLSEAIANNTLLNIVVERIKDGVQASFSDIHIASR